MIRLTQSMINCHLIDNSAHKKSRSKAMIMALRLRTFNIDTVYNIGHIKKSPIV
jgi:hypothetical protein